MTLVSWTVCQARNLSRNAVREAVEIATAIRYNKTKHEWVQRHEAYAVCLYLYQPGPYLQMNMHTAPKPVGPSFGCPSKSNLALMQGGARGWVTKQGHNCSRFATAHSPTRLFTSYTYARVYPKTCTSHLGLVPALFETRNQG